MTTGRLERAGRPALAWRQIAGEGNAPSILFLPGYASDMAGSKAAALYDWAAARGLGCTLFDYAGCGESAGAFADQTLDDWLGDTLAILDQLTSGPLLLVGSSMGGWLMLRAAFARPDRVQALIGIAAAPDFTEWDFGPEQRAALLRDGQLLEANPYGPEPTLFTRALWESGQASLMLEAPIAFDGPVALLHGQGDADVPWALALRIAERLRSSQVEVTLIKDGDHRLSRPQDIALLLATVQRQLERILA
jgi:pimeloyl-ACP methyl ester carboxylesterase